MLWLALVAPAFAEPPACTALPPRDAVVAHAIATVTETTRYDGLPEPSCRVIIHRFDAQGRVTGWDLHRASVHVVYRYPGDGREAYLVDKRTGAEDRITDPANDPFAGYGVSPGPCRLVDACASLDGVYTLTAERDDRGLPTVVTATRVEGDSPAVVTLTLTYTTR